MMSKIAILRFSPDSLDSIMRSILELINWKEWVPEGSRVFLKPNLTYPFYKHGVTTSPEVIESVVRLLRERTDKIAIGESDGGSHAWSAEEAFQGHRLDALAQKYGITLVNLSTVPSEVTSTQIAGRTVTVRLPSFLLHETDVFVSMPVPKVHAMTGVSLGFKNQWGCLSDVKRLNHHPDFAYYVLGINQLLRTQLCIFDGTYFLDRSGPMDGDPVKMNLVIASDDPGAGTLACCEIMGIASQKIAHLRLAKKIGLMPEGIEKLQTNANPKEFRSRQFQLKRTFLHYLALAVFKSHLATKLVYDSPIARPIHELLYVFRGRPKDLTPEW